MNASQRTQHGGFTLVELITVIILLGIMSVTLFSRLGGSVTNANLQAGRDDLIAALFFAQQTAMARSTNNIRVVLTTDKVSVTEDATPIVVHNKGYPLSFPYGVTATPASFTYDKLGRTTGGTIILSGSSGQSASVIIETSGYAH